VTNALDPEDALASAEEELEPLASAAALDEAVLAVFEVELLEVSGAEGFGFARFLIFRTITTKKSFSLNPALSAVWSSLRIFPW